MAAQLNRSRSELHWRCRRDSTDNDTAGLLQAEAGRPEEQNLIICQAFVDDVIVYLAKAGIRLNPLNVMKIRKNRWT